MEARFGGRRIWIFFVSNCNYQVAFAGCGSFVSNSANLVKLQALVSSIQAASTNQLNPHHIFTTNLDVHQLHRGNHFNPDGRLSHWINCITDAIRLAGNPCLHHIPKEWSRPASKLAIHGLSLHVITMFHQGRDLPRWIMNCFDVSGFQFN